VREAGEPRADAAPCSDPDRPAAAALGPAASLRTLDAGERDGGSYFLYVLR